MTDTSLDELARAASVGADSDVDRLLEALRPIVARWAVVLTGSPDTAEDVTQAVLLRVHRSIGNYNPSGRLAAWVYRIVRNVVVDIERKNQREQVRLERLTHSGLAAWLPERSDTLTLLGAADELRRFMRDLSPQQRAVLDLVELQGFTATEAGEMLEIAPATVRVHLHRAKAAMSQIAIAKGDERRNG